MNEKLKILSNGYEKLMNHIGYLTKIYTPFCNRYAWFNNVRAQRIYTKMKKVKKIMTKGTDEITLNIAKTESWFS